MLKSPFNLAKALETHASGFAHEVAVMSAMSAVIPKNAAVIKGAHQGVDESEVVTHHESFFIHPDFPA